MPAPPPTLEVAGAPLALADPVFDASVGFLNPALSGEIPSEKTWNESCVSETCIRIRLDDDEIV